MRILVVGAMGQLGLAVLHEYLGDRKVFDGKILLTVKNEMEWASLHEKMERENLLKDCADMTVMDVTDENAVRLTCETFMPDIILNCSAYTLVEEAEEEEGKKVARAVNVEGAANLAKAAKRVDAKFVHISTDYVFDGKKSEPYTEKDPTNPINEYGKSKADGEEEVKKVGGNYFIVRTSWLYGEGKNFVKTMLSLAETKKELRVVDNQFGTPTSAKELARLIAYLVKTEKYGLWHGSAEGFTSWHGFATEIMRIAKKDIPVLPVSDKEYPTKAKRPHFSVLSNQRLQIETDFKMLSWEEALKEYLMKK